MTVLQTMAGKQIPGATLVSCVGHACGLIDPQQTRHGAHTGVSSSTSYTEDWGGSHSNFYPVNDMWKERNRDLPVNGNYVLTTPCGLP